MPPRRTVHLVCVCLLTCALAGLASTGTEANGDRQSLSPESLELIDQVLAATDYPDAGARERARKTVQRSLGDIIARFSRGEPTRRKARRIHRALHRDYFKSYDPDADRLDGIVGEGRFNCLSATLFFGVIAGELGYRPHVIETPGHLFLSLRIRDRVVDVETTSSLGFDVGYRLKRPLSPSVGAGAEFRWLDERSAARPTGNLPTFWRVPLRDAVGFAWLNHAWRSLQAGETVAAARAVLRADRYLDQLGPRAKGVDRLLTHAFRADYDAGRFERAYLVARAALKLYPYVTSVEDRVLASALKRIQLLCDSGRPTDARHLLDEVAGLPVSRTGRDRLTRETAPYIVRTFVRLGAFEQADALTRALARVEPDRVEVERLTRWVALRRHERALARVFPVPALFPALP